MEKTVNQICLHLKKKRLIFKMLNEDVKTAKNIVKSRNSLAADEHFLLMLQVKCQMADRDAGSVKGARYPER